MGPLAEQAVVGIMGSVGQREDYPRQVPPFALGCPTLPLCPMLRCQG